MYMISLVIVVMTGIIWECWGVLHH